LLLRFLNHLSNVLPPFGGSGINGIFSFLFAFSRIYIDRLWSWLVAPRGATCQAKCHQRYQDKDSFHGAYLRPAYAAHELPGSNIQVSPGYNPSTYINVHQLNASAFWNFAWPSAKPTFDPPEYRKRGIDQSGQFASSLL
jgi:hypothetical protein